jgi:hypothetical protein
MLRQNLLSDIRHWNKFLTSQPDDSKYSKNATCWDIAQVTTRRFIPEGGNIRNYHRKNLKQQTLPIYSQIPSAYSFQWH